MVYVADGIFNWAHTVETCRKNDLYTQLRYSLETYVKRLLAASLLLATFRRICTPYSTLLPLLDNENVATANMSVL